MTNKQISKFIERYGGKNINFFLENKRNGTLAATTYFLGEDKKTKKFQYVIGLQKDIFKAKIDNKQYNDAYLRSILLHEIAHIKQNHFQREIKPENAEFEAQLWALHLAEKHHFNLIIFFVVSIFLGWADLKDKKRFNYYYRAYKKFYRLIGKKRIKIFRDFLDKCECVKQV